MRNGKLRGLLITVMLLVFLAGLASILYPYIWGAAVDSSMTMFDQVFYDGLPAAEKDGYNKYIYADGRVFYFHGGTGDITCSEASRQIDRRKAASKPAPPTFMNKPK